PALVLPILALGALWVVLWRGPVRFAGVLPMLAAFGLWALAERPPLLISGDGGLLGVATEGPRSVSAEKGAGFVARQWLENDGDLADQVEAAARSGFSGAATARELLFAGWRIVQLKGKNGAKGLAAACERADLVILASRVEGTAPTGCLVIDAQRLRRTGALAIWPDGDRLRVVPTQNQARLWSKGRRQAAFWLEGRIAPHLQAQDQ
ncbi:MAG: hypothetical protein L0H65_19165, partial [Pseudorhodobacter sp.]|nr:hypothetical protein [Pseudorhodobacter sp.]